MKQSVFTVGAEWNAGLLNVKAISINFYLLFYIVEELTVPLFGE